MRNNRSTVGDPDMSQEASVIHSVATIAIVMGVGALIALVATRYM